MRTEKLRRKKYDILTNKWEIRRDTLSHSDRWENELSDKRRDFILNNEFVCVCLHNAEAIKSSAYGNIF